MSCKRSIVEHRRTLIRECGTCSKTFLTTADTPWVRQVPRDGKKAATTYYCSSKCFSASYKHIGWYDGKSDERRKDRERKRDNAERLRRYNEAHREERAAYARRRRQENPGLAAADNAYYKKKRRLTEMEAR